MNVKSIRLTAVLAATAAAALVVTGCSDDESTSSSNNTTSAATSAAPGGGSAPAGKSAASVDGKALDAKFETTCVKNGNDLALALTDTANATYGQLSVSATVTGDTVTAVGIAGSKGGDSGMPYAVGYGNGAQGGSAKLSKSGNTYTITGEGVGAPDMSNPLAGVKNSKFEITFACSSIVGG
ncbi:lipoprotein LpqH [Nocardia huaxiensis]|uniref:Lipoprotein LpqH n=1 Tax=Nocardia huaxiensis TaxID=2755382 RepID=A0A7D7A0N8_9NOCA|nr:lipoprotein LpqH [Nocardia huaxiensis]QLY33109.1 lipoprotein LpqH [Nocardia huaxiensis]UFS93121.1 lipoprotein LpqH [Nocardia huaxiensis]